MPSKTGQPAYVHGTDPAEQDRLERLNRLLNGPCLGALRLEGGERVLDVGSGLGILARAMTRAAPGIRVTSVERDERQRLAAARLAAAASESGLLATRAGDAHALPLGPEEWGTFDIALARYVVEHSTTPERIVAEMARAVRPGGRVVLIEDDYTQLRCHPEVEGLEPVWSAFCRALAALGLDPSIGRRLPALLADAGLETTRSDWIFFGGCAGEGRFDLVARNFVDLIAGARETVLAHGGVDARTLDDTVERLAAWRHQPGAALWYGACYAEARRPSGAGFTLTP